MDTEIKILKPKDTNDFIQLIDILSDVFKMEKFEIPDNSYLESFLNKPDFKVLVVKHNNKVIGGLTVYVLHSYFSIRPTAYIYDVGVMSTYQRKGIGKKMLSFLTKYCDENGFEEVYVEAESNDVEAVNFYKTTSLSTMLQATHFTYSFDNAKSLKNK